MMSRFLVLANRGIDPSSVRVTCRVTCRAQPVEKIIERRTDHHPSPLPPLSNGVELPVICSSSERV